LVKVGVRVDSFKLSSGMGKKLVKPCLYFNNGSCVKKGDHDEVNVFYKHVCSHCFSEDRNVKECVFLNNIIKTSFMHFVNRQMKIYKVIIIVQSKNCCKTHIDSINSGLKVKNVIILM
jgi:hypothetical protein